jgi:hypothetical protein
MCLSFAAGVDCIDELACYCWVSWYCALFFIVSRLIEGIAGAVVWKYSGLF